MLQLRSLAGSTTFLDATSSRLKRDAIWWTIAGIALCIVTIVDGPILLTSSVFWLQVVGTIILPLVAFAFAGRDYLAYRRSLDSIPGRIGSDSISAESGPGLASVEAIAAVRKVFCSSCGVANLGSTEFCRSCGNTLVFLPTGTEGYLPQFLIRHLDRRIEKNAEIRAPLKSLKRIGLLGIYFGASAVAQGASGDIVACVLNAFCALTVFVISGWDYLAFIKTHPESVPESEPTFLDEAKRYFHDRSKQRQVVAGFVFLSVVTAFGVMWVPGAIPGIIVVWAILPGGFLARYNSLPLEAAG